jgi:hypothetical protein
MTTQQLYLFNGVYLVALVVVAFLTRATWRRIVGALVGGTAVGTVLVGAVGLGEEVGLWHFAIVTSWAPDYLTLLFINFALPVAPILLVTWRVARRFGWRGLAVVVVTLAAIGPPRDYWYMTHYPEWGVYGPGVAPFLAVAAIYASLVPVGQSVMRLVAGPARRSPLARRPWEKCDIQASRPEQCVAPDGAGQTACER